MTVVPILVTAGRVVTFVYLWRLWTRAGKREHEAGHRA